GHLPDGAAELGERPLDLVEPPPAGSSRRAAAACQIAPHARCHRPADPARYRLPAGGRLHAGHLAAGQPLLLPPGPQIGPSQLSVTHPNDGVTTPYAGRAPSWSPACFIPVLLAPLDQLEDLSGLLEMVESVSLDPP